MKRVLVISCIVVPLVALSFLFLLLYESQVITARYTRIGLTFYGQKSLFSRLTYTNMDSASPKRIPSGFAVHWKHVPYTFASLTTDTLKSLGFSIDNLGANLTRALYQERKKGNAMSVVSLSFEPDLVLFCAGCDIEESVDSYPFSFSYRGSPESTLPLTQNQLESIFGKPDSEQLFRPYLDDLRSRVK